MYRTRAILVLFAAFSGCAESAAEQEAPDLKAEVAPTSAIRVEVACIEPSKAHLELELPGEVKGWRDSQLAAPLGGYVEHVAVAGGEEVKKNQLLARVDSATHLARLAQAKVQLEEAKREHERAQALGSAIPDAERDAAKTRRDAAEASVRAGQVAANRTLIQAPFSGTIASVNIEEGESVPPGSPLMRLVQLDRLKVTASVTGRDVVALSEGTPAWLRADALSTTIHGEIHRIQPAANRRTRSFIVELRMDNPKRELLPGMLATVTLKGQAKPSQAQAEPTTTAAAGGKQEPSKLAEDGLRLVIPQDCLVTSLEEVGLFIAEDGEAHWQPVELGPVLGEHVVVESGLQAGDRVVVTGHRDLAPGDPLIVARQVTRCHNGRRVLQSNEK